VLCHHLGKPEAPFVAPRMPNLCDTVALAMPTMPTHRSERSDREAPLACTRRTHTFGGAAGRSEPSRRSGRSRMAAGSEVVTTTTVAMRADDSGQSCGKSLATLGLILARRLRHTRDRLSKARGRILTFASAPPGLASPADRATTILAAAARTPAVAPRSQPGAPPLVTTVVISADGLLLDSGIETSVMMEDEHPRVALVDEVQRISQSLPALEEAAAILVATQLPGATTSYVLCLHLSRNWTGRAWSWFAVLSSSARASSDRNWRRACTQPNVF